MCGTRCGTICGTMCRRGWQLIAAAALAAALAACSRAPAAGVAEALVAEVTVTRVARADISRALAVSGTIAALPNQDARVSALLSGRIARMLVAEGDPVKLDQVLAEIDDRPFRDQLRQAQAAVEQAQANLKNAQLSRERNETLFARGIAARKDLEDARTQQSVAEAALRQANASEALARLQLARCQVRTPVAGIVVKRFVSLGEQVDGTAAQPIFEVANLDTVELLGSVPAVYLGKIRIGQTLPITTDAFPGKTFTGRVAAISPAVDPATNQGMVRIRIANRPAVLRLGMFLTVQVPIEIHSGALVVPTEAIYHNDQGETEVFRVEGDAATAAPVTLGIEAGGRTELLSGVQAGETVILTGGYGLGEHTQVKIKP
jgi:RND family efflux transporter MFP subunit